MPILLVLVLMVVFNRTAMTVMTIGWIVVCIPAYFVWGMPLNWVAAASLVRQLKLAKACEETLYFVIKPSHLDR